MKWVCFCTLVNVSRRPRSCPRVSSIQYFLIEADPQAKRGTGGSVPNLKPLTKKEDGPHPEDASDNVDRMLPSSGTEGSEVKGLSFSIRPATIGDYEQLCCVWEVGDDLHHEALPLIFPSSGEPPMDRANVQALIAGPNSAIIVADAGGEVIGVMTI